MDPYWGMWAAISELPLAGCWWLVETASSWSPRFHIFLPQMTLDYSCNCNAGTIPETTIQAYLVCEEVTVSWSHLNLCKFKITSWVWGDYGLWYPVIHKLLITWNENEVKRKDEEENACNSMNTSKWKEINRNKAWINSLEKLLKFWASKRGEDVVWLAVSVWASFFLFFSIWISISISISKPISLNVWVQKPGSLYALMIRIW